MESGLTNYSKHNLTDASRSSLGMYGSNPRRMSQGDLYSLITDETATNQIRATNKLLNEGVQYLKANLDEGK